MKSVLTRGEAEEIFHWMASQDDLALHVRRNGCHARAHILSQRLAQKGIACKKIWADIKLDKNNKDQSRFQFLIPGDFEVVNWNFHVSILIDVQVGEKKKPYVFDVTLFDAPVSPQLWSKRMNLSQKHLKVTRPVNANTKYTTLGFYPGDRDLLIEKVKDRPPLSMGYSGMSGWLKLRMAAARLKRDVSLLKGILHMEAQNTLKELDKEPDTKITTKFRSDWNKVRRKKRKQAAAENRASAQAKVLEYKKR